MGLGLRREVKVEIPDDYRLESKSSGGAAVLRQFFVILLTVGGLSQSDQGYARAVDGVTASQKRQHAV